MSGNHRARRLAAAFALGSGAVALGAWAQDKLPDTLVAKGAPDHRLTQDAGEIATINEITGTGSALLEVPMVGLTPGGVPVEVGIANPMAADPGSAERGKEYFAAFNCIGCHAAEGGGGMGPALSDSIFKYGSDAQSLYLVISHGAPLGMPSWGGFLPDSVIWDLVSYVQAISKEPTGSWGRTASIPAGLPALEQVPSEFKSAIAPWEHVEPFSHGMKPTQATPTTGATLPLIPPEPRQ